MRPDGMLVVLLDLSEMDRRGNVRARQQVSVNVSCQFIFRLVDRSLYDANNDNAISSRYVDGSIVQESINVR